MRNKKYDTILFDMDGTLIDSDPMIEESFNQLCDLYRDGKRFTKEEVIYFSGPPIRETLAKYFPNIDTDFLYSEFHRICLPLYKTHVFPFPYCYEVLENLQKAGFKLGIVTNKQHGLTEVALQYLHLDKFFSVIVGLNDVTRGKPDGEGMKKAISLLNGNKVIYIGDNAIDYESAKNANIDCCLVRWGPRELSSNVNPTFFINSYQELEDKLYE